MSISESVPAITKDWASEPLINDICISATVNRHRVIAKTLAGGARRLAACLDECKSSGVLGAVAGNDVVVIVCRTPECARSLAEQLNV